MLRILFVCTGNTCRSPLAEGLLHIKLQQEGLAAEVRSAGVSAAHGSPISRHSETLLREAGFPETLTSKGIGEEDVRWADVILTMTFGHKRALVQRFPGAVDKSYTLREYVEDDPQVLEAIAERERLTSELHLKRALAQSVTAEEQSRILLLEGRIPDYDISDPFGGSLDTYRETKAELEQSLDKLVRKLRSL